jgi:stage II sporulation protein D
VLPLAACLLALAAPAPAPAVEIVRIAVATGASHVEITGPALACTPAAPASPAEGPAAAPTPVAGGRATLAPDGPGLALNGRRVPAAALRCSAAGPVRHGALALGGEVEVLRAGDAIDVVHALPMEEYVAGVAGSEMPPDFPPEALRAQAVAARTFALGKKLAAIAEGRPWHLGTTVVHQVYRGAAAVDPRARAAAEATAGEVLVFDHEPADAFFHAACGGETESGGAALGRDRPYLVPVRCGKCAGSPLDRWTLNVDAGDLGRALGLKRAVRSLEVVERTATGRAARVLVEAGGGRVTMAGADFRQRVGWSRLRSLAFDVERRRGEFRFAGRGAGHGAGLCQWGAAGLARDGLGWREILAHYYPGAEIVRMY